MGKSGLRLSHTEVTNVTEPGTQASWTSGHAVNSVRVVK